MTDEKRRRNEREEEEEEKGEREKKKNVWSGREGATVSVVFLLLDVLLASSQTATMS